MRVRSRSACLLQNGTAASALEPVQTLMESRLSLQIGHAAIKGVAWLAAQSLATRFIVLAAQLLLAWLLSAEDFGKIGLAYALPAFTALVVNPGIDDVLIQRQRHIRRWTTPATWMSLALGVAGAAGMVAIAPVWAKLYGEPQLRGLVDVLAAGVPLTALAVVPSAVLRASLRFRLLATIGATEILTVQTLTILFAWLGWGAYSFVIPVPIVAAARAGWLWTAARPKVALSPQRRRWRFLIGNGSAVFANRLLTTAVGQGDYAILGMLAPAAVVGAYYFAFVLAAQSLRLAAGNLYAVMFPLLSRMRGDAARQREATLKASAVLAAIVMPLCFLQAALARPVLHVLFGQKWDSAIPLMQLLSVGLPFDALAWLALAFLQAKGEFRRVLRYSCLLSPWFFVLVLAGAWWHSAVGVALGVALYYFIAGPLHVYLALGDGGVTWREVAALHLIPAALSVASITLAELAALGIQPVVAGDWADIVVIGVGTGLAYLPLTRWAMPDVWREVTSPLRALRA